MAELSAVGGDPTAVRRERVSDLGGAIRELAEAFVGSEVPDAELTAATRSVRAVTERLAAVQRAVNEPPAVDDLALRIRVFNPVTGRASPLAPPMMLDPRADDTTRCVGRVVLGLAFEGPFTYAHGGVIASLLDDILGRVASSVAQPVVTSRLNVRYRAPVPLRVPLVVTGTAEAVEGRRFSLRGTIVTEGEPGTVLAEAEGRFVVLDAAQSSALFGSSDLHESA